MGELFLRRIIVGVLAGLALSGFAAGCSDDDEVERERLTQQEIREERREAARAARQDERLKQVERDLREAEQANGTPASSSPPPSPAASAPASTGSDGSTRADSWPAGTSAWTVVLASAASRGDAQAVAARATGVGLEQVGVLFSSNYSSLHDGYWVAYTGVLSQAEARARQAEVRRAGFGDAYARQVSP